MSSSADKRLHLCNDGGGNRRDNRIAYGVGLSCFDQKNSLHWVPRRTITLIHFNSICRLLFGLVEDGIQAALAGALCSLLCWSTAIIMSFH